MNSITAQKSRRANAKERLLEAGRQLLWRRGYNDTGIQELLKLSRAPKGSFYHHFQSKEDFALQVLDAFADGSAKALNAFLADEQRPPMERLSAFFHAQREVFLEKGCQEGCLIGNFGQELADTHEVFRRRIEGHMERFIENIALCLDEAQKRGELAANIETHDHAEVLYSAWHGSLMRMKVQQSIDPVDVFLRTYFNSASSA